MTKPKPKSRTTKARAKKVIEIPKRKNNICSIRLSQSLMDRIDEEKADRLRKNPDDDSSDKDIILDWLKDHTGIDFSSTMGRPKTATVETS